LDVHELDVGVVSAVAGDRGVEFTDRRVGTGEPLRSVLCRRWPPA